MAFLLASQAVAFHGASLASPSACLFQKALVVTVSEGKGNGSIPSSDDFTKKFYFTTQHIISLMLNILAHILSWFLVTWASPGYICIFHGLFWPQKDKWNMNPVSLAYLWQTHRNSFTESFKFSLIQIHFPKGCNGLLIGLPSSGLPRGLPGLPLPKGLFQKVWGTGERQISWWAPALPSWGGL